MNIEEVKELFEALNDAGIRLVFSGLIRRAVGSGCGGVAVVFVCRVAGCVGSERRNSFSFYSFSSR